MAEALRADALGWLCRHGGWRVRQVVVGGRRREGRLWDTRIAPRLGLHFTAGPLRLLVAAMETPAGLPQLVPRVRAVIRRGLVDDPATGDLLALHRVVEALLDAPEAPAAGEAVPAQGAQCPECGEPLHLPERASLPPAPRRPRWSLRTRPTPPPPPPPGACPCCARSLEPADFEAWGDAPRSPTALRRELVTLSPLTLLFRPEAAGFAVPGAGPEPIAELLAPLFRGDRAVLCTYLDEALARAWLRGEARRGQQSADAAQESTAAFVRGLEGYLLAARARPDALAPLFAFFERRLRQRYAGGAERLVSGLRAQARGFSRASEREAFLVTASRLFALGGRLDAAAEAAQSAAYVERTEAEKVLLATYHRRYRRLAGSALHADEEERPPGIPRRDVAEEIEAIRRELAGEIG